MPIPTRKVKNFYYINPATRFKADMEKYRLKHNLPPIYSPTVTITDDKHGKGGKKYSIVYFEFAAKQIRPPLEISEINIQAKTLYEAEMIFKKRTANVREIKFVVAEKKSSVVGTKLNNYIVKYRKAIYRKHIINYD